MVARETVGKGLFRDRHSFCKACWMDLVSASYRNPFCILVVKRMGCLRMETAMIAHVLGPVYEANISKECRYDL